MSGAETRMEGRIRFCATLVILGLLVEAITLFWNSPASFLAFTFLGAGLVFLGIVWFLISLVTVRA